MLIEFRVANFRSFREEQTLSLVASKDEKLPGNLIPNGQSNLLKAAAVYGANASGKSNLIKAFETVRGFVKDSATKMNLGDPIPGISPFRLDSKTAEEPSSFEVVFTENGDRFEYGFSATRDRVFEEWLNVYPAATRRRQRWLERVWDPVAKETRWGFRGPLVKEGRILKEKTRDNGLVLSRGAELNIKALSTPFQFFRLGLWRFDLSEPLRHLALKTAMRVADDDTLRNRIETLLKHADFGIEGIGLSTKQISFEEVPWIARREIEELLKQKGQPVEPDMHVSAHEIYSLHRLRDTDGEIAFNFELDESNGTQRFFALAGPFLDALDKGTCVVVDEIDCSMHPLLVRKLVELFQSPEVNTKGAQIIFTTHDSTLMDPELFRRDQIYLVEKNSTGASQLFSLYDFQDRPRNTEAFQRNYLAGRYGAVPSFGPTFEDLEIK